MQRMRRNWGLGSMEIDLLTAETKRTATPAQRDRLQMKDARVACRG